MNEDLLQTIKDQVAGENYFEGWIDADVMEQRDLWPEICKRYAKEVAKASLKKASEYADFTIEYEGKQEVVYSTHALNNGFTYKLNKLSIDNESNIVL